MSRLGIEIGLEASEMVWKPSREREDVFGFSAKGLDFGDRFEILGFSGTVLQIWNRFYQATELQSTAFFH